MEELEMLKGARVLVDTCARVKEGEKVAIVTDFPNSKIAKALTTVVLERNAEVVILTMAPRETHSEEPPMIISKSLMEADVIFAPTKYSLTHSNAKIKACEAGARFISMPDFTNNMMVEGGLFENFFEQKDIAERVGEWLDKAKKAKVTTELGTDLSFEIGKRKSNVETGICHNSGSSCSPPDIETNVAPIEGTANGEIIVDGSIPIPEIRKLDEQVKLNIKEGKIKSIEGGREAKRLSKVLLDLDDPNVYFLAELGFGMNREAKIIGTMLEDEGVYGALHFGFGDNHSLGGEIIAKIHLDVIITKADVKLDNELIMKNGDFIF